jgi:membrane-bound lytic murein transglycosylase B
MKVRMTVRVALSACVVLGAAQVASAEIVFLTSGRTLSVKNHHVDGDSVVLTLRTGGQVTCDQTLIEKIVPDEVPHPDPAPPVAQKPAAPAVDVKALLAATPYGEIIASAAAAHGVDPMLVSALIKVESNFQPRARSSKGAMGLMQLMPDTAKAYKVRNPYDPTANIEAGVQHLKALIDTWGTEALALAAYNAGEGAVARFKGVPPYRETQSYVSRILSLWGQH